MASHFVNPITTAVDAIYASVVTMTTVGFGAYAPIDENTKRLVIGQLASAVLLFFGVFPLLISQLSTFIDKA